MRNRSRAAIELAGAPVSPCAHCGRDTRTVEGVCADCWVAKEPGAWEAMRRPARTEPLLDWGSLDWIGWWLVWRIGLIAAALAVGLVFGLR